MRKRSDIIGKVNTSFEVILKFEIVTSERKGGGFPFVVNDMLVDSGLGWLGVFGGPTAEVEVDYDPIA